VAVVVVTVMVRESMRVRATTQSELVVANAVANTMANTMASTMAKTVANTVANTVALGRTQGQSRAISAPSL
jgi:hypothetical protein